MDDATLKALLGDHDLPERDPAFTFAVMQGVARRRLIADILDLTPLAVIATVLLWLLAPAMERWLRMVDLGQFAPLAIGLVVSASLLAPFGLLSLRRMTET